MYHCIKRVTQGETWCPFGENDWKEKRTLSIFICITVFINMESFRSCYMADACVKLCFICWHVFSQEDILMFTWLQQKNGAHEKQEILCVLEHHPVKNVYSSWINPIKQITMIWLREFILLVSFAMRKWTWWKESQLSFSSQVHSKCLLQGLAHSRSSGKQVNTLPWWVL